MEYFIGAVFVGFPAGLVVEAVFHPIAHFLRVHGWR